jgi:putative oxidoreductase
MDVALLVIRVVVGLYLVGHGGQKLFGWLGGPGLAGTTGFLGSQGFRPARLWALAAGLSETAGGLLLVLGFLTPLGSLAIAAAMLTAIATAHLGKGWFTTTGGPELPLTNLAVAAAVAIAGPGRYALDTWFGVSLPEPAVGIVGLVLVLLGVATSLVSRRQPGENRSPELAS